MQEYIVIEKRNQGVYRLEIYFGLVGALGPVGNIILFVSKGPAKGSERQATTASEVVGARKWWVEETARLDM